jgi:putative transposase
MNQFTYKQNYRRRLPHIQPPEATLFVTFRLEGSIPKNVLEEWRTEKKKLEAEQLRLIALGEKELNPIQQQRLNFQRKWFLKFEDLLHGEIAGTSWLKDDRLAEIVQNALHFLDGKVFLLSAFCVMSNHVHTVFKPLMTDELARKLAIRARANVDNEEDEDEAVLAIIMQSLKGYTARECNRILKKKGKFWQHESFDRVVRDQAEFNRTIEYVINNPVKAGLVKKWEDWKWTYKK